MNKTKLGNLINQYKDCLTQWAGHYVENYQKPELERIKIIHDILCLLSQCLEDDKPNEIANFFDNGTNYKQDPNSTLKIIQ